MSGVARVAMVVEPSAGPSSASEDSKENLAEMGPEAPDSYRGMGGR